MTPKTEGHSVTAHSVKLTAAGFLEETKNDVFLYDTNPGTAVPHTFRSTLMCKARLGCVCGHATREALLARPLTSSATFAPSARKMALTLFPSSTCLSFGVSHGNTYPWHELHLGQINRSHSIGLDRSDRADGSLICVIWPTLPGGRRVIYMIR